MASAAQVVKVEKSRSNDCFCKPKRITADSSLEICPKKAKTDEPLLIPYQTASQHIEYESEDDSEQWGRSLTMAIDERLSALQVLLPQGSKMDDVDILTVLVQYVKELESQIKMYNSSLADDCGEHHGDGDDSPLQRRGLCIVPLSTLAQAL